MNGGAGARDVAVIGMAGRFPGAGDLDQFWRNLREGAEAVTFLTDAELVAAGVEPRLLNDPRYVRAASLLDGVEEFDAPFFGFNAPEAELLDPQQRLFLEQSWAALEDAGYDPARYEGLIGVYAGAAWNTYLLSNLTTRPELFDPAGGAFQVFVTNDKDFMPTRVSYKLNLRGPSLVLQTSCSTSLVAVHLACLSLLTYECDMALAGGVTVKVPQRSGYYCQDGGLASPDGHCRAFDARAAGTIFGSGIGICVLKRLADAVADGDTIRAVIKGSAINNDGAQKVSYTAPAVEGQAAVIAAAQAIAGVDPATLGYVECHGTGTALGDPIEVAALAKVFREATRRTGFCALGSVKTNVGHLDAAAGIAGLLKAVLALQHREIPPSLHFTQPNPAIDFAAGPFYVNARLAEWKEDPGTPRRAAVSSFGVGGTNAHVILEEAPAAAPPAASRPVQLLLLSARSAPALEAATDLLADALRRRPELCLADAAYTLSAGRAVFRHRRAVVCRGRDEAVARLASRDPAAVTSAVDEEDPRDRPVVFLFPGQGSQHAGMARGLYAAEPVFRRELDRCAELLAPHLGLDLRQVLCPLAPPDAAAAEAERRLADTALAQPALFTVEYALAQLWSEWGVRPRAMIGHSLGEYVAACLAGVLPLAEALALVAARGRLMARLPAGAMLSVPLPEEELTPLLPAGVSLAAVNEPGRCVASGPGDAVAVLASLLDERGIDHRRLHTSHAFHSAMMEPVLPELTAAVRLLAPRPPEIPFVSNLTGTWITAEQATDPGYWARHLRQPVRFAAGVEEVLRDPAALLLEVGPGRTLATLAGRHPARKGQPVIASMRHPDETGGGDQEVLCGALGQLWLAGLRLETSRFWAGEARRRVPLPSYPFERKRYWIEPRQRALPAAPGPGASGLAASGATGAAAPGPAAPGPATAPARVADLADWFYLPGWQLAPRGTESATPAGTDSAARPGDAPMSMASAPAPRPWLVLAAAADGFCARLAHRLRASGRPVLAVPPGEQVARTLDTLQTLGAPPWLVVDARALDGGPVASAAAPDGRREGGGADLPGAELAALLELARELGNRHAAVDLVVLGDGLAAVTDGEALSPGKAALLGLCRVLPQEHPQLACRVADLVLPPPGSRREAALIDGLVADVETSGGDELVAWRGAQRWVPVWRRLRLRAAAAPRPQGAWLISGGLRAPGLVLARALARAARCRLALVEPRLPADHADRVAALAALGAEVLVLEADLADAEAARRAVAAAERRFDTLDGVVHAAGTGDEVPRLLRSVTAEDCARAFRDRVGTLLGLESALAGRAPEHCLLLSSLATVLGGAAWSLPTAAAAVLDALARERARRGGLPWRSLGWDAWQAPERAAAPPLGELAALAIGEAEGEEVFLRALAAPAAEHLLVSTGDLAARVARRRRRLAELRGVPVAEGAAPPAEGAVPPAAARHPRPLHTVRVPPAGDLEPRIAAVWERVLGLEQIGVEDNFFALGGDSFVAVQVVTRLNQELGVQLPVAHLYQGLTVRALAALIERESELPARRAAHLAERRQAMERRHDFQRRRRAERQEASEGGGA
jgi:phthiocerol/phenolphthiocerol synthesis type-I polyketide synthase E